MILRMMTACLAAAGLLAGAATQAGAADDPPGIVVLALGDSITRGVRTGVSAEQTFSALVQTALSAGGKPVTVINSGIGGERTDQALLRLEAELQTHRPDFVTIMYGTNDCHVDQGATDSRLSLPKFRENLRRLIERIRSAGAEPILMTEPCYAAKSPANGLGEHGNVRLERYVQVTRDVAIECGTPLVDHFAAWKAAEAGGRDLNSWTTDGYHPNPEGHADLARRIVAVLEGRLQREQQLPWADWQRLPRSVTEWSEFPVQGDRVLAQPGALYFLLDQAPADGKLVLPRLNNVVHRAWWWSRNADKAAVRINLPTNAYSAPFVPPAERQLNFSQDPRLWTISLKADMTYPTVVVLDVEGVPRYAPEMVTSRPGPDGVVVLSARNAGVHGEKLQFEPLNHKNTVGYWVNPDDWAEWRFATDQPGEWEVQIFQGCGGGQGGSDVRLKFDDQHLDFRVEETGHFQNFRWRSVGDVTLPAGEQHTLELRCLQRAHAAVMDMRQIRLVPKVTIPVSSRDVRDVVPDVVVPRVLLPPAGPGRRVIYQPPGYDQTLAFHVLYLPTDWNRDRKWPVIVEFAGNGSYRDARGDVSSGLMVDTELALGLAGTDGTICVSLPLLNSRGTPTTQWWGDAPDYSVEPTVAYTKAAVRQICEEFGGDPDRIVLAGFSRGAIATHVVGLHDDEIAGLWRGLISFSHYDGIKTWPWPGSDRDAALGRLKRLGSRPELILAESGAPEGARLEEIRQYLSAAGSAAKFTFLDTGYVNHDDAWALRPGPARGAARRWLAQVLAEPSP